MTTRRSLMLALVGLLAAGCGDSGGGGSAVRIPSAAELIGTYDLTTTPDQDTPPIGGVGLVSDEDDLRIQLSVPYVTLTGPLGTEGRVELQGITLDSDAIRSLSGTAEVAERDGTYQVTGAITGTGFAGPTTFVMRRPVDADLRPRSGRYRLTLPKSPSPCACQTTVDLDLVIGAAGTGSEDRAFETDANGTVVGRLDNLVVTAAPGGNVTVNGAYANTLDQPCGGFMTAFGSCRMTVRGSLPLRRGVPRDATFTLQDALTFPIAAGEATVVRLAE